MEKCKWALTSQTMEEYHDYVWGVPLWDDRKLYRKLMLDINQAGLSWQTILNKSDAFDQAFDQFELNRVAEYDDEKVSELLKNPEIIRNRRKIEAVIHNAKIVQEIQKEFGSFSAYLWGFVNNQPVDGHQEEEALIPATNDLSDRMSKDMKQRGFKFIGSTIVYAFLQATGIINDHVTSCYRYNELKNKGRASDRLR